jgi:hypothetical protein
MAAERQAIRESIASYREALRSDRVALALAFAADIDARLRLVEDAVFGQGREVFELTPAPGDRILASPMVAEWFEARRSEADARAHEASGDCQSP